MIINLCHHHVVFVAVLRFGRFADTLYMATYVMHHDDLLIRINCTLSRIAQGLYLFCDHIIWLGRTGMANVNVKRWNRIANKYWLLMLIMNLTRDVVEINRLLKEKDATVKFRNPKDISNYVVSFSKMYRDVTVDTIKNSCDIFIPLSNLGYVNLTPSLIGLLGVVSSSAALYTQVNPFAKLAFT